MAADISWPPASRILGNGVDEIVAGKPATDLRHKALRMQWSITVSHFHWLP